MSLSRGGWIKGCRRKRIWRRYLSDSADPYATLRSTYLQSRESEIHGEDTTPSDLPDLDLPNLPSSACILNPVISRAGTWASRDFGGRCRALYC